ncbi:hypothetical protein ACFOD0_00945 [Shewanella intestini]|uniref:Uncharacterized protein n=1 Tax=Shewanella intestini TaxID=2017544 RepID=A0ABS5I0C7_9GAMM|nr:MULTISPECIES: hypothetical protein [Shewanella]MBR9727139.1 hypothetical protein [Shewanella intestini]MRG35941.1 hypothetical protein [Shewanella sp. XMDDZSB0408]
MSLFSRAKIKIKIKTKARDKCKNKPIMPNTNSIDVVLLACKSTVLGNVRLLAKRIQSKSNLALIQKPLIIKLNVLRLIGKAGDYKWAVLGDKQRI